MITSAAATVKAIKNGVSGWMISGEHFDLNTTPTSIKKLSKYQLCMLSKYFEAVKYTNELRTALSFEIAVR